MKIKYLLILIIFIASIIYYFFNHFIGKEDSLRGFKDLVDPRIKTFVVKYFLPHKINAERDEFLAYQTK